MIEMNVFRPIRMSKALDDVITAAAETQSRSRSEVIRECCQLVLTDEGSNVNIATILEIRNAARSG